MVQADRNYGFAGSVYEPQWARLISGGQSARWSVTGQGDLQVTAGTGDRALRVASGAAVGDGVLSEWDAAVTVTGNLVEAGERWDTVVIRRDWEQSTSTVMVLEGGSQRAPSMLVESTPGVVSDQPLALVRFAAGQSAPVEIADVRAWTGAGGGMVAGHVDALQYLTALGTTVTVGTTRYTRVIQDGSPTWMAELLVQDTGVLSPVSSTWSGGLRWSKDGRWVTLQARAQRVGGSLSSPINGVMYSLPAHVRPSTTPIGFNASRLNSGNNPTRSSDIPIRVETSGQVRFYITETSGEIVTGNYLFLNATYWTEN